MSITRNWTTSSTPEYLVHPPAWFHTRILVGAGAMLTPAFAEKHNIEYVINCAWDNDSPLWFQRAKPKNYICLRAIDSYEVNILAWYPVFESVMRQFLRSGEGTIFVHCQAGMNRSGFLALAYVARNFAVPFDSLIQATKQQRPCLFQNAVFMNQVKEFINGCIQGTENSGIDNSRSNNGNIGLSSSGHCADAEGVQNNAGDPSTGSRRVTIEGIRTLLHERSGQYCESKSDDQEDPRD